MENNYIAVPNNETYTKEERNKAFIFKKKKEISYYNRAKAQKKRKEKIRYLKYIEDMKVFGIPFTKASWEQHGIKFDEEKMKDYGIEFDK